ncbi:MAG: EpsG family protein [Ginsengibacter sp.]
MVFFAWLQSMRLFKNGLLIAFVILFVFLALRYNYGNDYRGYFEGFKQINGVTTVQYFSDDYHFEAGWIFLCRIFKPFGFFTMVACLALFNSWAYYRFIKRFVPLNYYWLAVFIYVFSPGMMLTNCSAMRQSLAIGLFLLAIEFINKKKMIYYFLLIGLASLFHQSALVLIPFYFLGRLNLRLKWYWQISLVGLFLSLFLFSNSISPFINRIISSNFSQYELYDTSTQVGSGIGVLILSFFYCLVLYWEPYQDEKDSILFKLSFISYFFIPLSLILVMLTRIGMYFQVANMAVFPLLYVSLNKSIWKNLNIFILILFTLYSFYVFFHSETYGESFGTYKTIFSTSF